MDSKKTPPSSAAAKLREEAQLFRAHGMMKKSRDLFAAAMELERDTRR